MNNFVEQKHNKSINAKDFFKLIKNIFKKIKGDLQEIDELYLDHSDEDANIETAWLLIYIFVSSKYSELNLLKTDEEDYLRVTRDNNDNHQIYKKIERQLLDLKEQQTFDANSVVNNLESPKALPFGTFFLVEFVSRNRTSFSGKTFGELDNKLMLRFIKSVINRDLTTLLQYIVFETKILQRMFYTSNGIVELQGIVLDYFFKQKQNPLMLETLLHIINCGFDENLELKRTTSIKGENLDKICKFMSETVFNFFCHGISAVRTKLSENFFKFLIENIDLVLLPKQAQYDILLLSILISEDVYKEITSLSFGILNYIRAIDIISNYSNIYGQDNKVVPLDRRLRGVNKLREYHDCVIYKMPYLSPQRTIITNFSSKVSAHRSLRGVELGAWKNSISHTRNLLEARPPKRRKNI